MLASLYGMLENVALSCRQRMRIVFSRILVIVVKGHGMEKRQSHLHAKVGGVAIVRGDNIDVLQDAYPNALAEFDEALSH